MEVRSPYAGKVVDLSVFSVGGVIGPGEKILDVVPEQAELVVEAKIERRGYQRLVQAWRPRCISPPTSSEPFP